jgi:Mg2+-importing ATPase
MRCLWQLPSPAGTPLAQLACCGLMGTVVRAGSGTGVVVATGGDAEFGRIAVGLGQRQPGTEFQVGLRKFPCCWSRWRAC